LSTKRILENQRKKTPIIEIWLKLELILRQSCCGHFKARLRITSFLIFSLQLLPFFYLKVLLLFIFLEDQIIQQQVQKVELKQNPSFPSF